MVPSHFLIIKPLPTSGEQISASPGNDKPTITVGLPLANPSYQSTKSLVANIVIPVS